MELFIDTIYQYPCLWNTTLEDYKDQEIKEAAWMEVVRITNLEDVRLAKSKWKSLRDIHRESFKKLLHKKNKNGKPKKIWKHQKRMDFLIPFMTTRDGEPGYVDTKNYDSIMENVEAPSDCYLMEVSMLDDVDNEDDDVPLETKCSKKLKNLRSKDFVEKEIETIALNNTKSSDTRSPQSSNKTNDALSQFFTTMYETTKHLPIYYQLQIKRKIFNVVVDAEEDYAKNNYVDIEKNQNFSNGFYEPVLNASPISPENISISVEYDPLKSEKPKVPKEDPHN